MTREAETRLDPASEALRQQAINERRDPNAGDPTVHVSNGHDSGGIPPERVDPFDARRALFAKSDARRETEANVMPDIIDPVHKARLEAMRREAAGVAAPAPASPSPQPSPTPIHATSTGTSQNPDERVSVAYNGTQISVARRDIDAAGGEQAYIRQRHYDEMDERFEAQQAQMRDLQARFSQQGEQLNRVQGELQQTRSALQDATASRGGSTPSPTPAGGSAASVDQAQLDAEYDRIIDGLYSGDPKTAREALAKITKLQSAQSDPNSIIARAAELAAERVRQDIAASHNGGAQPAPSPSPSAVDPFERTRLAINRMCTEQYPEIDQSAELTAIARPRLIQALQDPANKQRRAVDVARGVFEDVRNEARINTARELKQGLPVTPTAGGSAPAPGEAKEATASDFLKIMQDRRNFGPRNR